MAAPCHVQWVVLAHKHSGQRHRGSGPADGRQEAHHADAEGEGGVVAGETWGRARYEAGVVDTNLSTSFPPWTISVPTTPMSGA